MNVTGLRPDRWYSYQFSHRGAKSRIGCTRTFPAPGVLPARMRFAFCCCQHSEQGQFAAYRDMATRDPDFVVHVGDYIYDYVANPNVPAARRQQGGEVATPDDCLNRYALYRLDPHLQDTHAAFPFIVTFDGHEGDNHDAGLIPEDGRGVPAASAQRLQGLS